jgi:molybdopterin converting factor small subunit
MPIRVEFFGMARQRAGVEALLLDVPSGGLPLADVLAAVSQAAPQLDGSWVAGGRLHASLAANIDGQRFVSDPATPIHDGQSLLILSADAGG